MNDIVMLGAGHDANSSFMRGAAAAPDAIRRVLRNGAANLCSESGFDLGASKRWSDGGNVALNDARDGILALTDTAREAAAGGRRLLTLGGDHAITYPLVAGLHAVHGVVDILHFDAHGDLYPDFDDNPFSHASPFARILEHGYAGRLVQVGIRTLNDVQRDMIQRHGVETSEWRHFDIDALNLNFQRPLYISLDIDALDPAFAPGVSHHEPGGMSVRDVLDVLARVEATVVGADIVEYNPTRDWQDMTASVCAKFVKELSALMA